MRRNLVVLAVLLVLPVTADNLIRNGSFELPFEVGTTKMLRASRTSPARPAPSYSPAPQAGRTHGSSPARAPAARPSCPTPPARP